LRHRLKRENTVGASAVGDDLGVAVELREFALEFAQRDIGRSRQVPQRKLILGAHVEHGDEAVLDAPAQLSPRHRLQLIALVKVAAQNAIDLYHVALGHFVHRREHAQNDIVRQTVENELGVPPRRHSNARPAPPRCARPEQ
jgi:hypothetical protein